MNSLEIKAEILSLLDNIDDAVSEHEDKVILAWEVFCHTFSLHMLASIRVGTVLDAQKFIEEHKECYINELKNL